MSGVFGRRIRVIRRSLQSQRGFTVVEMMTVLMIIAILSALVIANTSVGNRRQQLRNAAYEFVNASRNVEAKAASSQTVGGTSRKAYGICVTSSAAPSFPNSKCVAPGANTANAFQLYARTEDEPDLTQPPDNPDILETIQLPKDYEFTTSDFFLDYVPPQPTLLIGGAVPNSATLVIKYTKVSSCGSGIDCRTINFRPGAGAVYVD